MSKTEYLFEAEWTNKSGDSISRNIWATCFVHAANKAMFDIRSCGKKYILVRVGLVDTHRRIYTHNNCEG